MPYFIIDKGKQFRILQAALTTDSLAGNPLANYFRKQKNQAADNNLRFWTAVNNLLNEGLSDEPLVRQKHYRALIHLYLAKTAERSISLPKSLKHELCALLPKDLGVTRLMEALELIAEVTARCREKIA